MSGPCKLFKSQYKKAKETLDTLITHKAEINSQLKSDYSSAHLQKELRTVNMESALRKTKWNMQNFAFENVKPNKNT